MRKKKTFARFIQKFRFKYRVSVLNENTLVESWHVRLSRFSVLFYFLFFTAITFFLLSILIFKTPVRYYLPGFGDSGNRMQIIQEAARADSLLNRIELQAAYLDLIKQVVSGEVSVDSILPIDSIEQQVDKYKTFVDASQNEKVFRQRFEEEEKFNLFELETKPIANAEIFFRPVRGIISSSYNLREGRTGLVITTTANENVLSVLAGTIIYVSFTLDHEWVVMVQHHNNYISMYKNNTRVFKNVGDAVKAGETIAITGIVSQERTKDKLFYFELWKEGKAVNPEEYILF